MGKANFNHQLISLPFLLGCAFLISCTDINPFDSRDFSAEEPFTFAVSVENQSRFELEGVSGTIVVTAEAGASEIAITGKRRVESHSHEDAQQHLEELDVSVKSFENKISVRTIQPNNTQNRNYIVDYTITLPEDFDVSVVNVSGNIEINSVEGVVRINSVSGDVSLNGIVGDTFAGVVSGVIQADITLPVDGIIELNTVSGAIGLNIPANTSAEVVVTVVSGVIRTSNLELQNINQTATSLRGTSGAGEGTITLGSVSGNIAVSGT